MLILKPSYETAKKDQSCNDPFDRLVVGGLMIEIEALTFSFFSLAYELASQSNCPQN